MRVSTRIVLTISCLLFAASCSDGGPAPRPASGRQELAGSPPPVQFSEVHYDNTGADTGEAIEISGPAGTDLTGWQVVLYNGNGGASYGTRTLSGAIPATCGARGVIVISYPSNGIQNGGTTATGTTDPDGFALIDAGGAVVEFLSYEGVFAATNGPALGVTSTDIGVRELGTEPVGQSLQRNGASVFSDPTASTFGACNDSAVPPAPEVASVTVAPAAATITQGATAAFIATGLDGASQPIAGVAFTWTSSAPAVAPVDAAGVATGVGTGDAVVTATAPNGVAGTATLHVGAAPPPGLPDTRVTEIHYDNTGTDVGEAIEIEGPAGQDLTGWSLVLYDGNGGQPYSTTVLDGRTLSATCGARGVLVVSYATNGVQNGSPDGVALVAPAGVVEFLSYEGTLTAASGPAAGRLSQDILAQEASSEPIGQSLQRDASNHWQLATATFGACNGSSPPPLAGNTISFSGRLPSDPALPVGFQDQLFATVRDPSNAVVTTTITWTSETPELASVDQDGVITALAAGTLTVRATAADGVTTATYSLPARAAVASTTAHYDGNTEFGEPTDNDPSDEYLVRHVEYTASFNPSRGTPNWVSYDLDALAFGPEDRCDCFTYDPELPASFARYTTAAYTGAGAAAGYGIDRGHLTRSFDRTSASLDNARTFLFTNIVPQAADLNQGPWSSLENDLGNLARLEDKEVYIVAGVAGNKGTLKNEGKIVIPASTWKVAVIMARDHGLANIVDYRDVEVIAVNMPNDPGIRNVPWQTYQTTVDAIELLTGYDLLALLPDKVETIVEAGIKPPLAFLDGPYAGSEGGAIAMSGAASLDPNGTVVDYHWDFGDGTSASGATVTRTYAQDGAYTVTLTVTDNDGLIDTTTATATVANVAPVVAPVAGATLLPGEVYGAAGSFTDPGTDLFAATVDYGDGTGLTTLTLTGTAFSLAHRYKAPGVFTVTVHVADDHVAGTATQTVTILSPSQAVQQATGQVGALVAAGKLVASLGNLLKTQLSIAETELDRGHPMVARVLLSAGVAELDLFVHLRAAATADAAPVRAMLVRILLAIG